MTTTEHVVDVQPGPVTVRLADVRPERVEWLWPGRLPLGKLVVLDGDPSIGKSTLTIDWLARVSTGAAWPDGEPCPQGGGILLSAEDGLADTIRPRVDAADGDPSHILALTEIRYLDDQGELKTRAPKLTDSRDLETAVRQHKALLVVVDVLMAYLPNGTDSHRDQDIRTVLAVLAGVAERTGCCIVLLRHLTKAHAGNPLYAGGGSIGIVGAARAGLIAAPDPNDDTGTRRVLAATKSNLAAMPSALVYQLVASPAHGCSRVEWLGEISSTARELLTNVDPDERGENDEAVQWLLNYLITSGGQARASDVIKAAARDGIDRRRLTRIRHRSGVTTTKAGFGGGWVWNYPIPTLPESAPEEDEEASTNTESPFAPSASPSLYDEHADAPEEDAEHTAAPPKGTPTHTEGDTPSDPRGRANKEGAKKTTPSVFNARASDSPPAEPRQYAPPAVAGCGECTRRAVFGTGACPDHAAKVNGHDDGDVPW